MKTLTMLAAALALLAMACVSEAVAKEPSGPRDEVITMILANDIPVLGDVTEGPIDVTGYESITVHSRQGPGVNNLGCAAYLLSVNLDHTAGNVLAGLSGQGYTTFAEPLTTVHLEVHNNSAQIRSCSYELVGRRFPLN